MNTSLDNKSAIEQIIENRKIVAEKIENTLENWKALKLNLEKIQNYPNNVDFSIHITKIQEQINLLTNIITRLSRNTFNIGIVGRMGQGKSQLLQTFTQLSNEIIPTSREGVCTSTMTKIYHEQDVMKAEIDFHTWDSFRDEVLGVYYKKLDLGTIPNKVNEFKNQTFPSLSEEKQEVSELSFIYKRLKEYFDNFEKYESHFGKNSITLTQVNEIKKYMVQGARDPDKNRITWDDVPIKEVRIFCNFNNSEVEKIGFVDLPGLGDDSILDVYRLITALEQDVDFIFFVRLSESFIYRGWEESDRRIFQIAKEALNNFSPSKFSFMVINQKQAQTTKDNDTVKNHSLKFKNELQAHFEVANCVIADCSKSEDVQKEILSPLIGYLTKNVNTLYNDYFNFCNLKLKNLSDIIDTELQKLNLSEVISAEHTNFQFWFDKELWPGLTKGLREKMNELKNNESKKDSEFSEEVAKVISRCRSEELIPTIDQIYNKGVEYDSLKIAYYTYIKEIRAELSNHFKCLSKVLQERINFLVLPIAAVLSEKAHLKNLIDEKEYIFFNKILNIIPSDLSVLKKAFTSIQTSDNSDYEKIISYWIRLHFEKLIPDKNLDPISLSQNSLLNSSKDQSILNTIFDSMTSLTGLDFLSQTPNIIQEIIGFSILDEKVKNIISILADHLKSLNQEDTDFLVQLKNNTKPEILSLLSEDEIKNIENIESKIENLIDFFIEKASKEENKNSLKNEYLIRNALNSLRNEVIDGCEKTFNEYLNQPNALAYVAVQKFVDSVISAAYMQTYWRTFLGRNEDRVWPKSKEREEALTRERQFKELLEEVSNTIKKQNSLLINV